MKFKKIGKSVLAISIGLGIFQYNFGLIKEVEAAGNKSQMMFFDSAKGYLNPPTYSANKAWEGNKLYWGDKNSRGEPMLWDILNTTETSFGGNGMLMFYTGDLGTTKFNTFETRYDNYNSSVLASVIDTAMFNSLTNKEMASTVESGRTNDEYTVQGVGNVYIDNFNGKKWFAPTGKMMSTSSYGYPDDNIQNKTRAYGTNYWFSSEYPVISFNAGFMIARGIILGTDVSREDIVARPATVIDSSTIAFVSDANGGKSGSSVLESVSTSTSGEWKLTLKDTTQDIGVSNIKRKSLTEISLDYTTSGNGNSLSAIITDKAEENILYYGSIASLSSSSQTGTATITLPDEFDVHNYKLKVFSEIRSGDKKTDYASEFREVVVPGVRTSKPGDTTVSYSTENIVPDATGGWEVVIPTSIRFTDTNKTSTGLTVQIRGKDATDTSIFHNNFKVDTEVSSRNGFKLVSTIAGNAQKAEYELTVGAKKYTPADTGGTGTIAPLTKVADTLAVAAELTKGTTNEGTYTYTDTITFTFTANADSASGPIKP